MSQSRQIYTVDKHFKNAVPVSLLNNRHKAQNGNNERHHADDNAGWADQPSFDVSATLALEEALYVPAVLNKYPWRWDADKYLLEYTLLAYVDNLSGIFWAIISNAQRNGPNRSLCGKRSPYSAWFPRKEPNVYEIMFGKVEGGTHSWQLDRFHSNLWGSFF